MNPLVNPISRWIRGKTGQGAYSTGKRHQQEERFSEAAHAFADAERWLGQAYGPDHLWTSQAAAQYAWCLVHLGRAVDAIPILERELARERRFRGETARAKMLDEYITASHLQE